MIVLDKIWRIDTDRFQFILYKEATNQKDESKPIKADATYHSSLGRAFEAYYKQQWLKKFGEKNTTLDEAIRVAKELREEVAKLRESIDEAEYKDELRH